MPGPIENILFLILGWLFGLFSPLIVGTIQRRREAEEVRSTILRELDELRFQLASAVYLIDCNQGTSSRSSLEWVKSHLSELIDKEGVSKTIDAITQMLRLSDENIELVVQSARAKPESTPALKTYGTPILVSRFSTLNYLDKKLQSSLVEIHLRLNLLNQTVEDYRKYFDLTFDKDPEMENERRIFSNLILSLRTFRQQAIRISDSIKDVRSLVGSG
ncbi:hypothetical protein [Geothrix mesophila]|uniref:hypothetical protein n=1 Tax=Geothrix mesophila TaxID=2922723 RepID=UPI001FABB8AB|nr:hypothetical protein [Geothrix sp. SG198]